MNYIVSRNIVFKEKGHERVFDASTDDLLAESCLIVLNERYNNPAWHYKPQDKSPTSDEIEFLKFYEDEGRYLPVLLKRYADRIFAQVNDRDADITDPDWSWYEGVQTLLSLPREEASGYKVPFRGRIIPTSYYLLIKRQNMPNESFTLVTIGNNND